MLRLLLLLFLWLVLLGVWREEGDASSDTSVAASHAALGRRRVSAVRVASVFLCTGGRGSGRRGVGPSGVGAGGGGGAGAGGWRSGGSSAGGCWRRVCGGGGHGLPGGVAVPAGILPGGVSVPAGILPSAAAAPVTVYPGVTSARLCAVVAVFPAGRVRRRRAGRWRYY